MKFKSIIPVSYTHLSPALYENERKHSITVAMIIYLLFVVGVLMSYYISVSYTHLDVYKRQILCFKHQFTTVRILLNIVLMEFSVSWRGLKRSSMSSRSSYIILPDHSYRYFQTMSNLYYRLPEIKKHAGNPAC